MQGLLVIVAPILLILFALSMERIEEHLRRLTVQRQDIQEFLEAHAPADTLGTSADDLMTFSASATGRADAAAANS